MKPNQKLVALGQKGIEIFDMSSCKVTKEFPAHHPVTVTKNGHLCSDGKK